VQDLAYPDQLALKRARVGRALEALGASPAVDIVGLEEPWRYRNKAEFTFGGAPGALTLGYHAARSFWRVVDLEDCLLLPEPVMRAAREIRDRAAATGLPAYHPKTHQGFFRHLLARSSQATGRVLLCLVTATDRGLPQARGLIEGILREAMERHPAVASAYWGQTDRLSDVAIPETLLLLGGEAHLEERVGPFVIRLHPLSFLQPATAQAERIYETLAEALRVAAPGLVWDLYCGLGLAGLYASRAARRVYGIDMEPSNVELARTNASANGVTNAEFRLGKVEELLKDRRFWLQEARPDAVIVDPPRAGLHPEALSSVLAARPARVAYLSCNLESLIRDLRGLLAGFPRYRIADVRAFDMFPQTNHVETLVWLDRC
jgi:23S rRNA (uracil1939-C5)-methyltransferase